ncbi:MAG: peptidase M13, partial [Aquiluna sp.]
MSMKPGLDKAAIKESVRVQDDLFRHVNGKWLDETDIPEDKAIYGSFHMLADDSELAVRELIEDAAKNPDSATARQLGDLYNSFMNEDLIEKLGAAPLVPMLDEVSAVANLTEFFHLLGSLE